MFRQIATVQRCPRCPEVKVTLEARDEKQWGLSLAQLNGGPCPHKIEDRPVGSPQKPAAYSDETRAAAIELLRQGNNGKVVAAAVGLSHDQVGRIKRSYFGPASLPDPYWTEVQVCETNSQGFKRFPGEE